MVLVLSLIAFVLSLSGPYSARACYKKEPVNGPLNAKGIKKSLKRNSPLNVITNRLEKNGATLKCAQAVNTY